MGLHQRKHFDGRNGNRAERGQPDACGGKLHDGQPDRLRKQQAARPHQLGGRRGRYRPRGGHVHLWRKPCRRLQHVRQPVGHGGHVGGERGRHDLHDERLRAGHKPGDGPHMDRAAHVFPHGGQDERHGLRRRDRRDAHAQPAERRQFLRHPHERDRDAGGNGHAGFGMAWHRRFGALGGEQARERGHGRMGGKPDRLELWRGGDGVRGPLGKRFRSGLGGHLWHGHHHRLADHLPCLHHERLCRRQQHGKRGNAAGRLAFLHDRHDRAHAGRHPLPERVLMDRARARDRPQRARVGGRVGERGLDGHAHLQPVDPKRGVAPHPFRGEHGRQQQRACGFAVHERPRLRPELHLPRAVQGDAEIRHH